MSRSFLRLPEVKRRVGLGRSAIYERMSAGTFPKAVTLGPKSVAWVDSEIDAWVEAMVANRQP